MYCSYPVCVCYYNSTYINSLKAAIVTLDSYPSYQIIFPDKYDPNGTCDDGSPMVYQIRSHVSTRMWFVMVGIANAKCQATLPYDVYTSTLPANVLAWIMETTELHI